MALYLVSYDIAQRNENEYQELWDYLAKLGGVKVLYSQYAVPYTGRALALANILWTHFKAGDRLLVSELFDGGDTCAFANLKISDQAFGNLLATHARDIK